MLSRKEILEKKTLRADVLSFCYLIANGHSHNPDDPNLIAKGTLSQSLEYAGKLPSDDALNDAIRYLQGLKALNVEWIEDGDGDWLKVRLEIYGMDLVEGSVSHKGLLFPKRRK